jgi:OmpA-OmpF porin, OOP family
MRRALLLVGVLACSRPIATATPVATRAEATPAEVAPVDAGGCVEPDGDGDGVVDVCDVCPGEAGQRPDGCDHRIEIQAQEIRILSRPYFAVNSAVLGPFTLPVLDEIAATLREHPEILSVALRGHASAGERGAAALSLRRAEVVRDYLTAHGVEASRLTVQGFGSDEPADPSATLEGRARNRRVEIQITPRDPPVRAPRSPRRWVPEGCPDTPPVRSGPCP